MVEYYWVSGVRKKTVLCVALSISLHACVKQTDNLGQAPVPKDGEWTDYGMIIEAGAVGDWDHFLSGGFATTIINKNGTYFLYYQGSSSYRYEFDETPCGRAIGVALSSDGINFQKYEGNPVLTWAPNKECEEGAVSAAAVLDHNGDVIFFYGANTAISLTAVNADGRVARSSDGLHFEDIGIVLDHDDKMLWGAGDEIFPIAAARDSNSWFVYYLPNGVKERRQLGVAWGPSPQELTQSAAVLDSAMEPMTMWGTGSHVHISSQMRALFLLDARKDTVNAWSLSASAPNVLQQVLAKYELENATHAAVWLDTVTRTWFMYYSVGGEYRVRLAPAGEVDQTEPSPPRFVNAKLESPSMIALSWSPADETDTGIAAYTVYRNGAKIRTVTKRRYSDAVFEHGEYTYGVAAINFHGTEGPRSNSITVSSDDKL